MQCCVLLQKNLQGSDGSGTGFWKCCRQAGLSKASWTRLFFIFAKFLVSLMIFTKWNIPKALWNFVKSSNYAKNLATKEEKLSSTYFQPIFWLIPGTRKVLDTNSQCYKIRKKYNLGKSECCWSHCLSQRLKSFYFNFPKGAAYSRRCFEIIVKSLMSRTTDL